MVLKVALTTKYKLDGVERLVKDMTDEQVRRMLEDVNVSVNQVKTAAKARNVAYGNSTKEIIKQNLILYLNGSDEGE